MSQMGVYEIYLWEVGETILDTEVKGRRLCGYKAEGQAKRSILVRQKASQSDIYNNEHKRCQVVK